jgi:hypothetical protein
MMGSLYADVYRPPTPDEIRERTAERNRRMYATPRPPTLVSSVEPFRPVLPGALQQAQMAGVRAKALERYDELMASGELSEAEAKRQVAAEAGVGVRVVRVWVQHRDKRGLE